MINQRILSSLIILLYELLFLNANSPAQTNNSLSNPNHSFLDPITLAGLWKPIDSKNYNVEFIDTPSEFTLKTKGDRPYYFSRDSMGNVLSSGYFPNWPPFNCDLQFISTDTLKITYSQLGSEGVSYLYVKAKQ